MKSKLSELTKSLNCREELSGHGSIRPLQEQHIKSPQEEDPIQEVCKGICWD